MHCFLVLKQQRFARLLQQHKHQETNLNVQVPGMPGRRIASLARFVSFGLDFLV